MKFSAFLALSLDGYMADEDHGISWLEKANGVVPKGEDCGYGAFFSSVDAMLMGKKTFEQVLRFSEWPYGDKPVYVLSRSMVALPEGTPETTSLISGTPSVLAEHLKVGGKTHVYVDGGSVVREFLDAELLDEITITIIPVTLGNGIPLFGRQSRPASFDLLRSKAFAFGFVQNTYSITSEAKHSQNATSVSLAPEI